jgi:ketosteroid isomerase-like protein
MIGADSEEPVRRFADAITGRDVEAAVAVCDPEIEFLSVLALSGRAFSGHEGIRQYFDEVASVWDEWKVEVHRTAAGPDGRVAILMTMHWRGRESGTAFSERAGHVWTLREGRLLRNEPFRDPEDALRELGAED